MSRPCFGDHLMQIWLILDLAHSFLTEVTPEIFDFFIIHEKTLRQG